MADDSSDESDCRDSPDAHLPFTRAFGEQKALREVSWYLPKKLTFIRVFKFDLHDEPIFSGVICIYYMSYKGMQNISVNLLSQVGMTLIVDHSGRVHKKPTIKDITVNREALWGSTCMDRYASFCWCRPILEYIKPKWEI